MSTYVHRIVQVKVSDKWETVKIYSDYYKKEHHFYDDEDKSAKEKEFEYVKSLPLTLNNIWLEDINNYSDNLIGLRGDLYSKFGSQTWDDTCPKKEDWQYNHCWATLAQLESWESELTDTFFREIENAYSNTKLEQILSILKKEEYNQHEDYLDNVNEIKEEYFWDILSLDSMISTAYIIAQQTYDIYDTNNIRILFYYD